jgi:hypothetical protein
MDFIINCYIQHPNYNPTNPLFISNPELQYIHINNEREIKEIVISDKKFDTIYIPMTITISLNDSCLLGFELDSGLSIWDDYISATEELLVAGKVIQHYGIEPVLLQMEMLEKNHLFFCIYDEFKPDKRYIEEIFSAKDFLSNLVSEIKNFLYKLKSYDALERSTSCEEGRLRMEDEFSFFMDKVKRVELLEEKIKSYFN